MQHTASEQHMHTHRVQGTKGEKAVRRGTNTRTRTHTHTHTHTLLHTFRLPMYCTLLSVDWSTVVRNCQLIPTPTHILYLMFAGPVSGHHWTVSEELHPPFVPSHFPACSTLHTQPGTNKAFSQEAKNKFSCVPSTLLQRIFEYIWIFATFSQHLLDQRHTQRQKQTQAHYLYWGGLGF